VKGPSNPQGVNVGNTSRGSVAATVVLVSALVGGLIATKGRGAFKRNNIPSHVAATAEPLATDCRTGALEPMAAQILIRRTSDLFPAVYLTIIAIIQGVALVTLLTTALPLVIGKEAPHERVMIVGQSLAGLTSIVVVSYEYIWFTTMMRWAPGFLDTLVPYTLGVGEIAPLLLIGNNARWWLSMAIFLIVAAGAFYYSIFRSRAAMFPEKPQVYRALRRLLAQLVACCLAAAAISIGAATFLHICDGPKWLGELAPWALSPIGGIMVLISERALNSVYESYGVFRQ
jgi:hypothetical protein